MSKRCIVTGASAGLGRIITATLVRRGDRVMAVGRDPARLEALDAIGGHVSTCRADVTQTDDCTRIVEAAAADLGGVDVLVNVVGLSDRGRVDTLSSDRVRELIDANVISTLGMIRAAADPLAQSRGVVINIGSLAARVAAPHLGGYAIAKHALAGLTGQLRLEWRDRGVHVGLINPGPIRRDDAGTRYAIDDQLPESARQPGGGTRVKGIEPQVVADAVVRMIDRRIPDIVLPSHLRYLIALGHLSPRLGDWLVRKFSS